VVVIGAGNEFFTGINPLTDPLFALKRRVGSDEGLSALLEVTRESLGANCGPNERALLALTLCRLGAPPELVSTSLHWREFEGFCAGLLKSSGFEVREDVRLRKPTAQIDILAQGPSFILSVDCKHWSRTLTASGLRRFADAQLKRSELFRKTVRADPRPIVSAILTLSEQRERFVEGVAIVPLFTLRDFVGSIEAFRGLLKES